MTHLALKQGGAAGFPAEIEAALEQVRDHCATIIEARCGGGARAKDVADQFGLHAKLGWQLWNVAYSHPLTTFRYLPNAHGIKVWRTSALHRNVPAELINGFEQAVENLRTIIDLHAEDREMFEILVDSQSDPRDEEAELRWRRQAFTGNSYTFGVRAKCMLASGILYPSKTPNYFSMVRFLGLTDLVQIRSNVRWPFAHLVVEQVDKTSTTPDREPLTETGGTVPLMTEFCSDPLPPVERRTEGAAIRDELLPGQVGQMGASTIVTGEILHDVGPSHGIVGGETAHFGTGIRTPSELLILDHIVHKSLFPEAQRELRVYSELISSTTRDDRDRLIVSERLQHLGRGLLRVRTGDVPRYADLLTLAFEKIGLDPNDFDVFRVRMRYPPMPVSVMVRHTLPPPP